MRYFIYFLILITVLICLILPVFNIYFPKYFSIILLFLVFLSLFIFKKNLKILFILILFNFIYLFDKGLFYKINLKPIYNDRNIIVIKTNKPWEFNSNGFTFYIYEKNKFLLEGKEIIPSYLGQIEDPIIKFENNTYFFYVNNVFNKNIIKYTPSRTRL